VRRVTAVILTTIVIFTLLSGCTGTVLYDGGKMSIVCTIFPQYDWVCQILGDRADDYELTLLLSGRVDLHSFQPTVQDFARVSSCDLFIYVGGESEGWVEGALKEAANKDMVAINLLDTLGAVAKEEEILEGMIREEPKNGNNYQIGYDEHVWLSPGNAIIFCRAIAGVISLLDAGNAETYGSNLSGYIAKLEALDSQYRAAVEAAPASTLVFGDRFPFRYLTDDYGLIPFAAFPGCSAETEASFETFIFLANKMDELGLGYILVTESADRSVARAVIGNTREKNQQILVLNSMQSVSPDDMRNGATYISIMESNLNILREALGSRE